MTVLVHATDTLWIHDTLYISLPMEQRTYADSTYTAWISGYHPKLDSILIYPQTTTITILMVSSGLLKEYSPSAEHDTRKVLASDMTKNTILQKKEHREMLDTILADRSEPIGLICSIWFIYNRLYLVFKVQI